MMRTQFIIWFDFRGEELMEQSKKREDPNRVGELRVGIFYDAPTDPFSRAVNFQILWQANSQRETQNWESEILF